LAFVKLAIAKPFTNPAIQGINKIAFYIGYDIPLLLALVCFVSANMLKKRIKRKVAIETVQSIGKNPENIIS
jgi:hypothetical protein